MKASEKGVFLNLDNLNIFFPSLRFCIVNCHILKKLKTY